MTRLQISGTDDPIALEGAALGAFLVGGVWAGLVALLGLAGVSEGGFHTAHALRSGAIVVVAGAVAGGGVALWRRAGRRP